MLQQLPTSKVVVDGTIYPRIQVNQDTVDEYAELLSNEVEMDPIILDQHYRLLDGNHRLQAHIKLNLDFIEYRITTVKDDYEAYMVACRLNSRHGKGLSRQDREKDARSLYEMKCTESKAPSHHDVEDIAVSLGVSTQSVHRWCKDIRENIKKRQSEIVSETGNNSEAARQMGLTRQSVIRIAEKQKAKPALTEEEEDLNGVQKAKDLIKEKGVHEAIKELMQTRRGAAALLDLFNQNLQDPTHPFTAELQEDGEVLKLTDERLVSERGEFGVSVPLFNCYLEEIRSHVASCKDLLSEKAFKDVVGKANILNAIQIKDANMQRELFQAFLPLIEILQDMLAIIDPEFACLYKPTNNRDLYHVVYDALVKEVIDQLEEKLGLKSEDEES